MLNKNTSRSLGKTNEQTVQAQPSPQGHHSNKALGKYRSTYSLTGE